MRIWKQSYAQIGQECERFYESLRGQMAWMQRNGERAYSLSAPKGGEPGQGFFGGVQLFTPGIQRTQRVVDRAARMAVSAPWQQGVEYVSAAIDSVSRHLATIDFKQTPRERRILLTWKNSLEALRCAVLGVRVTYVMSESLLTARQLVFLTIDSVRALSKFDSLEILFPSAMNHEWSINEVGDWRFRVKPHEEFRILSPEKMQILPSGLCQIDANSAHANRLSDPDSSPGSDPFQKFCISLGLRIPGGAAAFL